MTSTFVLLDYVWCPWSRICGYAHGFRSQCVSPKT